MTLLGRRVGSGRTSPSGAQAYWLLVKRSAGLGTINIRYKLSNTLHYTHTYRHFTHTHTPGMRSQYMIQASALYYAVAYQPLLP